jgi:N-acetylglucosaminyl-diphospho-decaprenol L-rhamnosyltransferase
MFARVANHMVVRVSEIAKAVESSPRVVIAIVATDEAENIVGCLRSLNRFLYRDFGIIICENGGYDPFQRDLRELAKIDEVAPGADCGDTSAGQAESWRFCLGADRRPVTILRSRENRGYSGGVNACIAAAGNNWDFIWVLNPDTFPEPDALGALVRRQAQGGYGIVGSRIVFVSSGRVQLWGGLTYWPLLGRCRSLGVNKPFETTPNVEDVEGRMDIVAGTSMFVSKDYIKTVGVMDEDFFVYYEDTEWSLRRGKFRLGYAHDSVVRHVAGSTSGSGGPRPKRSRFSIYLSERNRVLIAKKRHPAAWPVFALAALLQSFELLIRFRSPRSFQFALDGWWAGLVGETGMPGFMRDKQGAAAKVFLRRAD